jgi:hypothetical protein
MEKVGVIGRTGVGNIDIIGKVQRLIWQTLQQHIQLALLDPGLQATESSLWLAAYRTGSETSDPGCADTRVKAK